MDGEETRVEGAQFREVAIAQGFGELGTEDWIDIFATTSCLGDDADGVVEALMLHVKVEQAMRCHAALEGLG